MQLLLERVSFNLFIVCLSTKATTFHGFSNIVLNRNECEVGIQCSRAYPLFMCLSYLQIYLVLMTSEHNNKFAGKHIPLGDLLGERPMKSRSSSSLSQVGQFASLAQRSVDEFMSRTAPFRCSPISSRTSWPPSKCGTRASGLRAPSKSTNKVSSSRYTYLPCH